MYVLVAKETSGWNIQKAVGYSYPKLRGDLHELY